MKQTIKKLLALLVLLVTSTGAWAAFGIGDVVWTNSASGNGTITCKSVVEDLSYYQVTITVTPATGYSIIGSSIVVANKADAGQVVDISEVAGTNYGASRDITFICPKTWTGVNLTATFVPSMVSIGDNKYPSLASAFDAVLDGQTVTIKIDNDIDETGATYSFPGGTRNITIDLNGKNVSFTRHINGKLGSLSFINGTGTVEFGNISNAGDVIISGSTITTRSLSSVYNLTITNSTLNCSNISNSTGGNPHTLLLDNSTVTCDAGDDNCLQWMADFITLQNNASLSVKSSIWVSYDDDFRLSIDNSSQMQLTACAIGAYNYTRAATEMNQYAPVGTTVVADGSTKNTVLLKNYSHDITITEGTATVGGVAATKAKATQTVTVTARATAAGEYFTGWTAGASDNVTFANAAATTTTFTMPDNDVTIKANFATQLQLMNALNERMDVTFWVSDTEPTSTAGYTDSNAKIYSDAGKYIIVRIKPKSEPVPGYWTNKDLLVAVETTAAPARHRAPGVELGRTLTKLGSDQKNNGEGWYYYQIPADHSVANGYTSSTIDGFAPKKFDLRLAGAATTSTDGKTLIIDNTEGWTANLDITGNSFEYNGANQGPQLADGATTIQVKRGTNNAVTLPISENMKLSAPSVKAANSYPTTAIISEVGSYSCFFKKGPLPFEITQRELALNWTNTSLTFNGDYQSPTCTATNVVNGDEVKINVDAGFMDAFTGYTATAASISGASAANYKLPTANTTLFDIAKKPLTAKVKAQDKVYDGNTTATVSATVETGVTGDELIISGLTGTFEDAEVGTNKTVTVNSSAVVVTATLTDTHVSNYDITYPNTTANITSKGVNSSDDPNDPNYEAVTLTIPTEGYVYDGTEKKPAVTVKDGTTVLTQDKDYTVTYTNNKDAGENTAVVTVTGKGDYTVNATRKFSIAKKALTATVKAHDKPFDGKTDVTVSATVETGVSGETLIISGLTGTFDDADFGTDKPVTINSSAAVVTAGETGTKTTNYTISYPTTATASITSKLIDSPDDPSHPNYGAVTLDIPEGGYVYDGTEKKPAVIVKYDSEVLTLDKDYTVTYTNNKDAGTATVTIGSAGEYVINTTRKFEIAKKPLTATVTVEEKTYDGSYNATVSATVETGVTGETLTISGLTGTFDNAFAEESKTVTLNTADVVVTAGANTKATNYTISYPATTTANILPRPVTVSDITAKDKVYDGTTDATLVVDNAIFENIVMGDNLTVSAKGTFEDEEVGENKTVNITDLELGGSSKSNYVLAKTGNQETTTATIFDVDKELRQHSGIRVVRNDTGEEVPNEAYLRKTNYGMYLTKVVIEKPADATESHPVSVSVYIPEELKDFNGASGATEGVGSNSLVTSEAVPVTDVYLPDTETRLSLARYAFRIDIREEKTARIHTSLRLLDDYALAVGLRAEYRDGNVMTTVTPSTKLWTFSSAIDIVMPDGLTGNTCKAEGTNMVIMKNITSPTANVEGTVRTLIKANNGVVMEGKPNESYLLRAWPCEERPTGMWPIPTGNARSYADNELEPVIEETHFTPTEYYILYNNEFHELDPNDQTSVSACKAVLPKTNSQQSRTLAISNGTTNLSRLTNSPSMNEGEWYDLQGRKLDQQPTKKGVYILNGRKVVIK